MKILILSRYSSLGASSRLRTMQYLPALSRAGIEVEVASFFDNDYLVSLYEGRSVRNATLRAFQQRFARFLLGVQADLLWIEKECLPWLPWMIERVLLPRRIPIVVDYDDAVFHRYDLHSSGLVRRLLGNKIDQLMAASSLVVAGNPYLAERARNAGASRVEIVPTVVDVLAYRIKAGAESSGPLRIGWIGTPGTWKSYMAQMMPMLTEMAAALGARLTAVGAGKAAQPHPLLDVVPWSEETEVELIRQMDIGLMPLDDSPWSRGKCGYKLIQYMACGVPVLASPVGINAEIVEHGVNGLLVSTEADWRAGLSTLLNDANLRFTMGAKGRRRVEMHYSLQAWEPRMVDLLRGTAKSQRYRYRGDLL